MEDAMNLNHIHIGSKDLKKSMDFYSTIFGFTKKLDHDPGIFLENNAGFLIAIDPVGQIPQFPSWFHFGFCLKFEAEVYEIYKTVKEKNITIARDMMFKKDHFASFFINDLDGYKIEVSWHNE